MMPKFGIGTWVRSLIGILVGSLGTSSFEVPHIQAQLIEDTAPDRNLGTQVQRDFVPGVDTITGGTRPQNGVNLFHSFQEFNIAPGRSVYFLLPDNGIQNVLARVTGLNPSQIEGTLGTRVFVNSDFATSSANLFLINPNGIIFGQGARLDIGGSFVATTANAIQFGNQGFFSASNPDATPLLTINPSAFLFNQITSGPIINRSRVPNPTVPTFIDGLRVSDGLSLLLLGGELISDGGFLQARGGRIELVGIQGLGNVDLIINGNTLDVTVPDDVPLADITLANGANLDASGFANTLIPIGGEIQTHSANLALSNGSTISSNTFGNQNGGTISIRATQVRLSDQSSVGTTTSGSGNSGDIEIYTEQLQMQNTAQVGTGNFGGTGNSGKVFIQANQSIDLQNASQFGSLTIGRGDQIGVGNAGDIVIRTGNFNIQNGGGIITTTFIGDGDSGNIDIQARNISLANSGLFTSSFGLGASGSIAIRTGTLNLIQGAGIQTSSFDASTYDFNSLSGTYPPEVIALVTALRDTAPPGRLGQANSGDLSIEAADSVNIIGTSVNGNRSRLSTETLGNGAGGRLTIKTSNLKVSEGGLVSTSTSGSGPGGSLTVNVAGTIDVAGTSGNGSFRSGLGSEATNTGNAGYVTVTADQLLIRGGGIISASTFNQGRAGNLTVNTTNSITLDGTDTNGQSSSGIFSTVAETATGKGGNVSLRTRKLSLTNGATVNASTFGNGRAGDVSVTAEDIALDGTTPNGQFSSGLFSIVASTATGTGGNVNLNTRTLSLTNGAVVNASTFGNGDAGNMQIHATESFTASGLSQTQFPSGVFTRVVPGAGGKGGNIDVVTSRLVLEDDALIDSATFGKEQGGNIAITADWLTLQRGGQVAAGSGREGTSGNFGEAGNIFVDVAELIELDGDGKQNRSGFFSETSSFNRAGDITVNTNRLLIRNGAAISSGHAGSGSLGGDGGNLNINASESIELVGRGFRASALVTEVNSLGNAGRIDINTGQLIVRDGAIITSSTSGLGDAGDISVRVGNAVNLDGGLIFSTVDSGGVGNAGDIDVQARSLTLTSQADFAGQIAASVDPEDGAIPGGQGRGGTIRINTSDSVSIAGTISRGFSSGIFANTRRGASGQGGNIIISTGDFVIKDGGVVTTQTQNASNGGNIEINTRSFEALSGGQIVTGTFSSGRAGNITLNATNDISIFGNDPSFINRLAQFGSDVVANVSPASGLFANTSSDSTGQGGTVLINPNRSSAELIITDGAGIGVNSQGQGDAGNLNVYAQTIKLNNNAFLSAETVSANGGNITLQFQDLLLLRNSSRISATAGTDQAGGNGGNVIINAPRGFIVGVPSENSDITANAFTGSGGRVNITAQGIFGLQFRPNLTPFSDITASSTFGVSGVVTLNTPNIDPNRGLVQLPQSLIDTNRILANSCIVRDPASSGTFLITGAGGLPVRPGDALLPAFPMGEVQGVERAEDGRQNAEGRRQGAGEAKSQNSTSQIENSASIVEAQGIYKLPGGQVILSWECPR